MGTRAGNIITKLIYYPLLTICCLEVALLILGYRCYKNTQYTIEAEPQNAYAGHSELGIQLNPGKYAITINDSLTFKATHQSPTSRVVKTKKPSAPGIAMLGCSFTYGFGVNDEEHFTSLLQAEFPNIDFYQRAVVGHGTVQSLITLKELVQSTPLAGVFLQFSSEHLMRNTLSPTYRSHLKIGYGHSSKNINNRMNQARFPYVERCNGPILYAPWSEIYEHWPGRRWSATVNWLQTSYDRWHEDIPGQIATTACLLQEINQICQDHNIIFSVVSLDQHPNVDALKSQVPGIRWIDTHFDFSDPNLTNKPFDNHPSTSGHRYLAERIKPYVAQFINE